MTNRELVNAIKVDNSSDMLLALYKMNTMSNLDTTMSVVVSKYYFFNDTYELLEYATVEGSERCLETLLAYGNIFNYGPVIRSCSRLGRQQCLRLLIQDLRKKTYYKML